MITLYETISADRLNARKQGQSHTVTSLGIILGEAKQLATKKENRDPTDSEVISVLKKNLDGLGEMLSVENDPSKRMLFTIEQNLFLTYMPVQLSASHIEVIIHNAAIDNLGKIMALFKLNYAGQYDGKVVKEEAEKYIASLK